MNTLSRRKVLGLLAIAPLAAAAAAPVIPVDPYMFAPQSYPHLYVLEGREVRLAKHLFEWATWVERSEERQVRHDTVGQYDVSTVFLGMDHNFRQVGPPVVFETCVFDNGKLEPLALLGRPDRMVAASEVMGRYSTWDEAERGHAEVVAALQYNEEQIRLDDAAGVPS